MSTDFEEICANDARAKRAKGLAKGPRKGGFGVFCANAREIYEIDLRKAGSFGRDFEQFIENCKQFIEFGINCWSNLSRKAKSKEDFLKM